MNRTTAILAVLGLALGGCGATEVTVPATTSLPAPVASRVEGSWVGTLPTGEPIEFFLTETSPNSVEGTGAIFRSGDEPESIDVEGTLGAEGEAFLQLTSTDELTAGQESELNMQVSGNTAQAEAGGRPFQLQRPAPLASAKLWNDTPGGGDVYRIDARNDFGQDFQLRVEIDGSQDGAHTGTWQYTGGSPLWAYIEGKVYAEVIRDGRWVVMIFQDEFGGPASASNYGQLMFERHVAGQPGSSRPLSRTDSRLNSREAFGYVTGRVILEQQ